MRDGGTQAVLRLTVAEPDARPLAHPQVRLVGGDVHVPGHDELSFRGDVDGQPGDARQPLGKAGPEARGDVLDDEHGRGKLGRQGGEDCTDGKRSTRGGTDEDRLKAGLTRQSASAAGASRTDRVQPAQRSPQPTEVAFATNALRPSLPT